MAWLDHLRQDLRYALRGLKRSPGFAATVIITLGLGIGANAAMFGVVDRLMFRPFPYMRDPGTVHRAYLRYFDRGQERTASTFEYTRYLDLATFSNSFSQHAGFSARRIAVGRGEASRERQVATVSASFFQFFDAAPALGRFFVAAEDTTPKGAEVAVLGYAFWQSEFGGRQVIGEVLQVGNVPMTIVGVAPESFAGLWDNNPPALYVPITTYAWHASPNPNDRTNYFTRYNWGWMAMLVRRKPDVSAEQASADLAQAHVRSWDAEVALNPGYTPTAVARPSAVASGVRLAAGPDPSLEARTTLWVTGVAAIVLLIACANVANLFLARAIRRRRETAVRVALGVSRKRLAQQAVTESLVLALFGAGVGLLVAQWGGAGLRRLLISQNASLAVFTDWRTLAVTAAAAILAGLLTGIVPALLATRGGGLGDDLAGSLKSGTREGTYHRSRTRTALLIAQGALSVLLLVGAALFVKSLSNVRALRMGYDAEPVLLVERNLRGQRLDDSAQARLGRDLLVAAQALPGVEHASWVSSVPFWSTSATNLYVAGIDSVRALGQFTYQTATTDYFAAMDTRIVRGRGFTSADRGGSPPIVVVSESMARVLWPGKDALGQCLRVGEESSPCRTVVGIAEDMIQRNLAGANATRFHYYLPIEQYQPGGGFALLLRMRGDPAAQQEEVRRALQRVMPGEGYVNVQPFNDLIDSARRSWQLGATMFVAFGVLALVVAAVGLYGVIGYNVTQRMHELGVRIALGAQAWDVVRLVVRQSLVFAVAGIALGAALALALGRFVEPLLFRQSARDPAVFALVAAVLLAVALVASASPARRATRADPSAALRSD